MREGWSARCSVGNRLVHDRVKSHEYGGFDLAAPQRDVGQRAIVEVLQPAHGAALRRHCKPVAGQRLRDLLPPRALRMGRARNCGHGQSGSHDRLHGFDDDAVPIRPGWRTNAVL
jgi:hypothetical protein